MVRNARSLTRAHDLSGTRRPVARVCSRRYLSRIGVERRNPMARSNDDDVATRDVRFGLTVMGLILLAALILTLLG
jgi:hypothetical protein